jgi:hypothetical protein
MPVAQRARASAAGALFALSALANGFAGATYGGGPMVSEMGGNDRRLPRALELRTRLPGARVIVGQPVVPAVTRRSLCAAERPRQPHAPLLLLAEASIDRGRSPRRRSVAGRGLELEDGVEAQ